MNPITQPIYCFAVSMQKVRSLGLRLRLRSLPVLSRSTWAVSGDPSSDFVCQTRGSLSRLIFQV